jgi:hypothetical protein
MLQIPFPGSKLKKISGGHAHKPPPPIFHRVSATVQVLKMCVFFQVCHLQPNTEMQEIKPQRMLVVRTERHINFKRKTRSSSGYVDYNSSPHRAKTSRLV